MKFYIPTSSLNMDNILQSECILPISHYAQRLSGYKSYEQIDELRPFNAIVLFKYPVKFSINDSGRYNYPVLIELEDDAQTQDFSENEIQDGVYVCHHALNLTPTNCRFYFFSEQAYRITLVNTQSNKSIKFFKEYSIVTNTDMLKLKPLPELVSKADCEVGICEDGIIDKQKGVLFAAILGDMKSVNHDLAVQMRLTQEIYNILTGLISNPSSIIAFKDKLSILLDEYKSLDSTEKDSKELFNVNLKNELGNRFYFLKGCLIEFLKHIGCWDYVFNSLCKKWGCYFLPQISELNTKDDFIRLRSDIDKRTVHAVSNYHKSLPPSDLNDVSINGNTVVIQNAPLVNAVINYIIECRQTPEKLYADRLGFYMESMKAVIPILKEQMDEQKWEESKERAYVNNLHAFINEPAFHFNINSIDNIELKSIAAFVLKGQSYNDCVTLCKMAEFENYRYVLSMWGALCGYMEMNKNALYDILDMSRYSIVYQKLYNRSMGTLSHSIASSEQIISKDTGKQSCKFSKEGLAFILKTLKFKEVSQFVDKLELLLSVSSNSINECFEKAINEMLSKRATKQREFAKSAFEIYQSVDNYDALCETLKEFPLPPTVQKNIFEHFGYSLEKKNKKNKKKQDGLSLFPEMNKRTSLDNKNISNYISHIGKSILKDTAWIKECATFISDARAKRQFIEDMEWFVGNHNETYKDKKKGEIHGYYFGHDKTNQRVLERLRVYMENKIKNKSYPWLADIYAKIPINEITNYISKVYGI